MISDGEHTKSESIINEMRQIFTNKKELPWGMEILHSNYSSTKYLLKPELQNIGQKGEEGKKRAVTTLNVKDI